MVLIVAQQFIMLMYLTFRHEANWPQGTGLRREKAAGGVQGVADQAEHQERTILSWNDQRFNLKAFINVIKNVRTMNTRYTIVVISMAS